MQILKLETKFDTWNLKLQDQNVMFKIQLSRLDVRNLKTSKVWCSKPQYQSVIHEIWNIKTRMQFSQNLKPQNLYDAQTQKIKIWGSKAQNQNVMLKTTRKKCNFKTKCKLL